MDEQIIQNIKSLGLDMIENAKSGHPGIVLGAAPILYTLYSRHMHVYNHQPEWINKDRFILSAGHGSALLYATLFMAGLDYQLEDLKQFRTLHARVPGHPEVETSSFIDASTGPLGEGVGMAIGMALAQKILQTKCGTEKSTLFDYYIYVLCGDGDLMEGISYEATSFAGVQNLDHLILLYDSNHISLDGPTDTVFHEDITKRFEAMGWYTDVVENGEDIEKIDIAIQKAKLEFKPSLIQIHTTIGKDSLFENTSMVHGKPLTREDTLQIKEKLHIPRVPFYVNSKAKEAFQNKIKTRSQNKYTKWKHLYEQYRDDRKNIEDLEYLQKRDSIKTDAFTYQCVFMPREATRDSNGKIMNEIAKQIPYFVGGSADVSSSTKTHLHAFETITKDNYDGRNISFGVREHAMGAILNGLSLNHFRVFGSTFLVFADYLKPAIRLSALMKEPVTYIFTHDSIYVGEDGPTHQPIEQLSMLRSIPNLYTFRPCDAKEIIGAWNIILSQTQTPSALILSRHEVPIQKGSNIEAVAKGAYILKKEYQHLDGILLATGTEVETSRLIAEQLYQEKHTDLRVVSMPCMELYKKQDLSYQEAIIPPNIPVIVLEAGSSLGWEGFVTNKDYLLTIDHFGKSGRPEEVLFYCGYTLEQLKQKIETLIPMRRSYEK